MSDKEYFEGFDEAKYNKEAQQKWESTSKYQESQQKWSSYSASQKVDIKAEGGDLVTRMVTRDPNTSPQNVDVQAAVGEYFDYLNKYFYTCDLEFFKSLADMWVADPAEISYSDYRRN